MKKKGAALPRGVKAPRGEAVRAFSVKPDQLATCNVGSLVASHWKEDGTCRCEDIEQEKISERRVGSVEKILEGAFAALEVITLEELKILEKRFVVWSQLQQSYKDLGKATTLALFVRGARETLYPIGKGL